MSSARMKLNVKTAAMPHLNSGVKCWYRSHLYLFRWTMTWRRWQILVLHLVHLYWWMKCNLNEQGGRYYHASVKWRAVIWRAVRDEKPIIEKNSNFRNYFWKI